jgi:nuclear pore complex protein Nup62
LSSSSSASASSSSSVSSVLSDPGSRIRGKTVEEILAVWSSDLDRHVSAFLDESLLIAQWDDQLLSNAATIASIQSQVTDIQQQQLRLNRCVDVVQQQQTDLNAQLDSLETALEAIKSASSPLSPAHNDDVRREETYRLAEELDEHLSALSRTLSDTVAALNQQEGGGVGGGGVGAGAGGGGGGLQAQLTEILNVHLQSLQWLETEAESIEREIGRIGVEVGGVKAKASSRFNGGSGRAAATI